jgi:GTPase SAR1 family protein
MTQKYLHAEKMPEPLVKVEGDLPPVQVSNSMDADKQIMDEPGAAQEATNIPANANPSPTCPEAHTTNKIEPVWKLCDDRPRVQQVKINEEAAEHSRKYFENVENLLKKHSSEVVSCETRLKEIGRSSDKLLILKVLWWHLSSPDANKRTAAIHKRKKNCEVRIGFLGSTGTGKSSLINALLHMEVLPRNEEVASTAVPVEVSYNIDNEPEHLFKAVIEGISKEEFTKEVKNLFKNKEIYDKVPAGEDDEVDIEAYQQMLTTIEKIKWVYPYLQTVDDIDNTSAEVLLNEQHVQKMLDSKEEVQASSEPSFARDIKKYIESSKPKQGDKAAISLWPLVKVVRIYVKSDILRCGIILVDLPGSHDTSAARVAVADNYRKNLTASVVCAPAVRAGSDRVAQELLSSVERRNMQLDGLYTSDSLFFVITKIDDLMDYKAYIRDHENLQDSNKNDMQRIRDKTQSVSELRWEVGKREPKLRKNVENLGKMNKAHEKLATRVTKILEDMAPAGHKRKRLDDVTGTAYITTASPNIYPYSYFTASDESDLKDTQKDQIQKLRALTDKRSELTPIVDKEVRELYTLNQKIQYLQEEIQQAKSRVTKSCIQNRAQIHVEAARNEYEIARRMMGQQNSEKPLEVFSVSSAAFTRHCGENAEEAISKGFSTKADTGIPALRDALIGMTWGIRQHNARSFNEDVESCHNRMKLWSADTSSEYKMLEQEKVIVQDRMDAEIEKLEVVCFS